MSLFSNQHYIPLARRCAPKNFDEYEGQEHLIGEQKAISMMVAKKMVQSMVFYGPPASGKTGLARIIADCISAKFISVNALNLNNDDIRHILQQAEHTQGTVLFIDEIHRLIRPKQDVFLDAVESGKIILIGATTENPYFTLQPALRSRILIFEFFALSPIHLKKILHRALSEDSFLQELSVILEPEAEEFLITYASDPRNMLTVLETVVLTKNIGNYLITKDDLISVLQKSETFYDHESAHYDVISAFIKSIRGSDPDAALYYLALMIESGEDPRFIFRRLLISAVEDVGLAYPEAISIVHACAESFERVGFPEGSLLLSHAVLLLAGVPKSNSVLAIQQAQQSIRSGNVYPVPAHLKDSHYSGAKETGYLYPHDFPEHFVEQQYLPEKLTFYQANGMGFEKKIKDRLSALWQNRYEKDST
ncbi:MAG: replication-associated recombination protein A [Brevinema sp.]